MVDLAFRFDGADAALDALDAAVVDAIEAAVARGAEVVAFAARAEHPYTDRTGNLTESIEALPAVRTADGAVGGVVAGASYAEFVERRPEYAFLGPAARRSEDRLAHELDDALEEAVRRGAR